MSCISLQITQPYALTRQGTPCLDASKRAPHHELLPVPAHETLCGCQYHCTGGVSSSPTHTKSTHFIYFVQHKPFLRLSFYSCLRISFRTGALAQLVYRNHLVLAMSTLTHTCH
ncbi:hypothetical protein M6B38_365475 [Iris pallida]|uniref:Uncharacterized protein n=1 Tax=Iris pallida TaxID=29817 RepID=A0AAX6GGN6_IRIPA|nr:hypothetical protein M6B38_365475 [Iris pallida]